MASLRDKSRVFLHFSLLAAIALPLLGCPPVVVQPRTPTDPKQILEWTLGRQHLASQTSPDVFLVLIPKEKLKPPTNPKPAPSQPKPSKAKTNLSDDKPPMSPEDDVLSECLRATSVLPAPQDDGRIFLAVNGAVQAVQPPNKTVTVLGNDQPVGHVAALLAVRRVKKGLEIVAEVQVENKPDPEIHILVVDGAKIVSSSVADLSSPSFDSDSALFQAYTVPHCNRDGKECLTISNNDETSYLEKTFVSGDKNSVTLAEIKGARDAVWAPGNDGSVYVLKACSTQ